jgi:hypothetical protein
MRGLYSPLMFAVVAVLVVALLLASPNAMLWAAVALAFPIIVWVLGGTRAYPVLVWLIGMNWLQIAGDVLGADLNDHVMGDGWMGQYRERAVYFSLSAMLAMALGMRCGTRLGAWAFGPGAHASAFLLGENGPDVRLRRVVAAYFATLVLTEVAGATANAMPTLAQPVLALALLKFVCVYLAASTVFASDRGYQWLILISLFELTIGIGGFFAGYKEAFFVIFVALAASRGAVSLRKWLFAATAVTIVIWVSLVWTVIKTEYRYEIFGNPLEQRVAWFAQRIAVNPIDYNDAALRLVQRIGYTEFYARLMARLDTGAIPRNLGLYGAAVQHVLTPRVLFPDKLALDDSKLTTALLGFKIGDDTSIGVGYVAEAHVDFEFPGMLVPLLMLGAMLGGAAQYFMTRRAPLCIREGFATASLFLSFSFAANIDKALGGFITGFLVMAMALKFGYPIIAQWLAGGRSYPRADQDRAPAGMPI